jgi:hypothetical protein
MAQDREQVQEVDIVRERDYYNDAAPPILHMFPSQLDPPNTCNLYKEDQDV